jgi:putative endonuclease
VSRARLNLGDAGERYAERLLVEQGWRILERKWRGERGEIDLIADDGDQLVFVEVKTRRGEQYGSAEEALSSTKCSRLIDLGAHYIDEHPDMYQRFWRVDLLAITIGRSGRVERVTHIRDTCLDE